MNRDPIASLMHRELNAVDMDDTVADVERRFAEEHLRWAPVTEGGRSVLGVISAQDLVAFHARGGDASAVRAWQLCTYKPLTVRSNTPIGEVARLMVARHLHHVVVTEDDRPVGVVSSLDFVRQYVRC